jgi:hypothetical protein
VAQRTPASGIRQAEIERAEIGLKCMIGFTRVLLYLDFAGLIRLCTAKFANWHERGTAGKTD